MRAGRLRHRITIQSRSTARGEYGGQIGTWEDVHTSVAASVEPLKGRELLAAGAVQNETDTRIITRYIPGITASMRVVFGDRSFDILNVINVGERNKELQIMASEGGKHG